MQLADPIQEGARIMGICNSCRYCEGYCAVFPAMERRLNFLEADLNYLANLCHNCAECYYACQYAPPHQFAVNVPKTLAEIRARSYQRYAWPSLLAAAFKQNERWVALTVAASLFVALAATAVLPGIDRSGLGFYDVISHGIMAGLFGAVAVFALLALTAGVIRCWRESSKAHRPPRAAQHQRGTSAQLAAPEASPLCATSLKGTGPSATLSALASAAHDVATLKYLDNGGAGCTYPRAQDSQVRRWFHHCTFYGFLLCFAATSVAAVYHYAFGWIAPYSYFSLPVVLGTLGGIGLLAGPAGLYWLKQQRDPAIADTQQDGTDVAFLALLFLTSITGLMLLALRQTVAMGSLLLLHLGVVLALFATLPYGKFVHGFYRAVALLRYALERQSSQSAKPPSN